MRTVLIATVKNEGPFLLEWVAWNRLIGFDDIIIAQNDSNDMTKEILLCLESIGAIHFIENSLACDGTVPTGSHQMRAYDRASDLPIYAQADWAMSLDCDEFLVITTDGGQVSDLIKKLGDDVDQIHVHWTYIGSQGEGTFKDELVTTRFFETESADRIEMVKNGHKTLYRTSAFRRVGIHRPRPENYEPGRAVTASGLGIEHTEMGLHSSLDPGGQKYAQVFHYQIRDAESFTLAKIRGRANPGTTYFETLGYWAVADKSVRKTDLLQRERMRILDEIDRLDSVSGGILKELHKAAVAVFKERIAAFKADPIHRDFYEKICRLQKRLRSDEKRQALIELYDLGEISWRPK